MSNREKSFPCKDCPVPEAASLSEDANCAGTIAAERTLSVRKLGILPLRIVFVEVDGYRCPLVGSDIAGNLVGNNGTHIINLEEGF